MNRNLFLLAAAVGMQMGIGLVGARRLRSESRDQPVAEDGKAAGGSQPPKWLSTHPAHGDRIAELRVYAEKVMPLYAAAKGSAAAGK